MKRKVETLDDLLADVSKRRKGGRGSVGIMDPSDVVKPDKSVATPALPKHNEGMYTPYEFAALAAASYGAGDVEATRRLLAKNSAGFDADAVDQWEILPESTSAATFFRRRGHADIVCAVRGTDISNESGNRASDLMEDALIGVGVSRFGPRTRSVRALLSDVKKKYRPPFVSLTGHSLGGKIATNIAMEEDTFASVYNMGSSPVDPVVGKVQEVLGLDKKNVVHYTYEWDAASASARVLDNYANTVVMDRKSLNPISGNHGIGLFVDPGLYTAADMGVFRGTMDKKMVDKKVDSKEMFMESYLAAERKKKEGIRRPDRPAADRFKNWTDEYGETHAWFETAPYAPEHQRKGVSGGGKSEKESDGSKSGKNRGGDSGTDSGKSESGNEGSKEKEDDPNKQRVGESYEEYAFRLTKRAADLYGIYKALELVLERLGLPSPLPRLPVPGPVVPPAPPGGGPPPAPPGGGPPPAPPGGGPPPAPPGGGPPPAPPGEGPPPPPGGGGPPPPGGGGPDEEPPGMPVAPPGVPRVYTPNGPLPPGISPPTHGFIPEPIPSEPAPNGPPVQRNPGGSGGPGVYPILGLPRIGDVVDTRLPSGYDDGYLRRNPFGRVTRRPTIFTPTRIYPPNIVRVPPDSDPEPIVWRGPPVAHGPGIEGRPIRLPNNFPDGPHHPGGLDPRSIDGRSGRARPNRDVFGLPPVAYSDLLEEFLLSGADMAGKGI